MVKRLQDPAPEVVQRAAEMAGRWASVPASIVLSPRQTQAAVAARNAVLLGLRRGGGYSMAALARALRRDEATLSYALPRAEAAEENDPSFAVAVRSIARYAAENVRTSPTAQKASKPLAEEIDKDRIFKLKRRGWSVSGIARHFTLEPSDVAKILGVHWGGGR